MLKLLYLNYSTKRIIHRNSEKSFHFKPDHDPASSKLQSAPAPVKKHIKA